MRPWPLLGLRGRVPSELLLRYWTSKTRQKSSGKAWISGHLLATPGPAIALADLEHVNNAHLAALERQAGERPLNNLRAKMASLPKKFGFGAKDSNHGLIRSHGRPQDS